MLILAHKHHMSMVASEQVYSYSVFSICFCVAWDTFRQYVHKMRNMVSNSGCSLDRLKLFPSKSTSNFCASECIDCSVSDLNLVVGLVT